MPDLGPDTVAQIIATVAIGVIAVVGSILGAIRGAEVGAAATRAATQQAIDAQQLAAKAIEEQQQNSVRLLLSLEIDHNLAILRTFWAAVPRGEVPIYSMDPEGQQLATGRHYALALLREPLPVWTRKAWEGLMPLLPLALSRAEIEQANAVYGRLDMISAIRAQLAEMAAEKTYREDWDSAIHGPRHRMRNPRAFDENASVLWDRFEQIVDQLLTHGNPISEQEEGATEAS